MKYALYSLLCVFCWSCSTDTAPKQITYMADLYTRYLVPEQQIKAEATFMTGDTLNHARPIAMPSSVYFNGKQMGQRHIGDKLIRYNYETIARPIDSAQFSWPHPFHDGHIEVSFPMPPIDSFRLSAKATYPQQWEATLLPPLQAGEQVVIMLIDAEQKAFPLQAHGPQPLSFVLSAPQSMAPAEGPMQYYFVRKYIYQQQAQDARITAILETYSVLKELPLSPSN